MRKAARVDANQEEVVKALRKIGAAVEIIGLPVDLLVHHRGANHLVEVKTDEGRLTKYQVEFIARWPGPVLVVRGPEDAVRQVIGKEAMA